MTTEARQYTVRISERDGRDEPLTAFGTPEEIVKILALDFAEAMAHRHGLAIAQARGYFSRDIQEFMRRSVIVLANGTGMIPCWMPMALLGQPLDALAFLVYMASIADGAILTILGDDAPQANIVDIDVVIP